MFLVSWSLPEHKTELRIKSEIVAPELWSQIREEIFCVRWVERVFNVVEFISIFMRQKDDTEIHVFAYPPFYSQMKSLNRPLSRINLDLNLRRKT